MSVSQEYRDALNRIADLEAKLDDYAQYSVCDCCYSLTDDPVDCGGHLQCESCTRIAELEAKLERQEAYYRGEREENQRLLEEVKLYKKLAKPTIQQVVNEVFDELPPPEIDK